MISIQSLKRRIRALPFLTSQNYPSVKMRASGSWVITVPERQPCSGRCLIWSANGRKGWDQWKKRSGNDEWKSYLGSFLDEGFWFLTSPDEYFRFVGKLHNYSDADMKSFYQKFEELFNGEIIGKDKYISDLSKGNLKRWGLRQLFMGNPQIIMLWRAVWKPRPYFSNPR